jgi:hypothetical protein
VHPSKSFVKRARVCVSASAALCEITLHAEQRLMMQHLLTKTTDDIDTKRDVHITGVEPFLEQVTSRWSLESICESTAFNALYFRRVIDQRLARLSIARIKRTANFLGTSLQDILENAINATFTRNLDISELSSTLCKRRNARVATESIGIFDANRDELHYSVFIKRRTLPRRCWRDQGCDGNKGELDPTFHGDFWF